MSAPLPMMELFDKQIQLRMGQDGVDGLVQHGERLPNSAWPAVVGAARGQVLEHEGRPVVATPP